MIAIARAAMIPAWTNRSPPHEPPAGLSSDERNWAMGCHFSSFLGYVVAIPFGSVLGPLICWLAKRESSPFIDANGKESVNFQISIAIYFIVCIPLMFVLIGFALLIALAIFNFVVVIIAGVRASEGRVYRYPLCIRFIK